MLPERSAQDAVVLGTAKRMLYTRSMVRMQRACGAKHQKLLATKEGERAFSNAFLELLDSIDGAISSCSEHRTMEEQRREDHFAQSSTTGHVLAPIHEGLAQLPWERFLPPAQHVELLYDSLQKFLPESHAMLGHIFIRIEWNNWFAQMPQPVSILSRLFTIFVKIAFEPNIHIHPNTSKILEDAIRYPWHLVECSELEQLLKWFVASVEPAIALKIPAESNYADRAVLEYVKKG